MVQTNNTLKLTQKKNIVLARIKRSKLDEVAGEYYRNHESSVVKRFKNAFVGIQREDGLYTIIAEECIYYSTDSGTENKLPLSEFLICLKKSAFIQGKKGNFEYLRIENDDLIWLLSPHTVCAIWNIVQLLDRNMQEEFSTQ